MQRRKVKPVVVPNVVHLVPVGIGRRMGDEVLEVGGRISGPLRHRRQGQALEHRREIEMGEVAGLSLHLGAGATHPAEQGRQGDRPPLVGAPVGVKPARRSGRPGRRLRNHRRVIGMPELGGQDLGFAHVGAAVRPHFARRPRLLGDPPNRVVAVVAVLHLHGELTFRLKFPANILGRNQVPLPREKLGRLRDERHRLFVIRRPDQDHREPHPRNRRPVEVGGEPNPIPHRHHHIPLDREFVLGRGRSNRRLGQSRPNGRQQNNQPRNAERRVPSAECRASSPHSPTGRSIRPDKSRA